MSDYWIISESYPNGRATLAEAINYQLAGLMLENSEGDLYGALNAWWHSHVRLWAQVHNVSLLRLMVDIGWNESGSMADFERARALIVLRGAAEDPQNGYNHEAAAAAGARLAC